MTPALCIPWCGLQHCAVPSRSHCSTMRFPTQPPLSVFMVQNPIFIAHNKIPRHLFILQTCRVSNLFPLLYEIHCAFPPRIQNSRNTESLSIPLHIVMGTACLYCLQSVQSLRHRSEIRSRCRRSCRRRRANVAAGESVCRLRAFFRGGEW